jgi:hypothetical protein
VWSVLVVPVEQQEKLGVYRHSPCGNDSAPQPLLDCQNGPFQDGKTAVFAKGAEAWPDPTVATPFLVTGRGKELAPLIADQVFRRPPCSADRPTETRANFNGRWRLSNHRKAHDAA